MKRPYYEIRTHGVGSSCGGDQYHHTVTHLAKDGRTLCGVEVRGQTWWNGNEFTQSAFENADTTEKHDHYSEERLCLQCAKRYQKEIK